MRQAICEITIETRGKGLTEFTAKAEDFLGREGPETGLLTLFCRHTSASLIIQETPIPTCRRT